ncbi:uncharacterized protein V2V93DRAFT_366646 [Kockiozyma suomiensis]|uniref:uncharacterized protein n=1 Tax=Kockiozyma suomiensis TaxID=1337062 RepID=UPI003343C0E1
MSSKELTEVPPVSEPMEFSDASDTADATAAEPTSNSAPEDTEVPASLGATASPRMPSMTDVLNSAPSSPVAKITSAEEQSQQILIEQEFAEAGSKLQNNEEEHPPPPPPRPLSPFSQAQHTLEEAFPSIDKAVIKAVLIASGGQVDPAFNALLSMSDPGFKPDLPPRPNGNTMPLRHEPSAHKQLLEDEALARKLAKEINSVPPRSSSRKTPPSSSASYERRTHRGSEYDGTDDYLGAEREYSFFDDDLPIIKENLSRGFQETRSRVNEWVANFKKKIDGEDDDSTAYYSSGGSSGAPRKKTRPPRQAQYDYSIGGQQSYDKDPTELDGNFAHLNLKESSATPPLKPPRPSTNSSAATASATKHEDRLYSPTTGSSSPRRSSGKWEPLRAVEPTPDKDPFFIGDSDDEGVEELGKKQVRFASGEDDLK